MGPGGVHFVGWHLRGSQVSHVTPRQPPVCHHVLLLLHHLAVDHHRTLRSHQRALHGSRHCMRPRALQLPPVKTTWHRTNESRGSQTSVAFGKAQKEVGCPHRRLGEARVQWITGVSTRQTPAQKEREHRPRSNSCNPCNICPAASLESDALGLGLPGWRFAGLSRPILPPLPAEPAGGRARGILPIPEEPVRTMLGCLLVPGAPASTHEDAVSVMQGFSGIHSSSRQKSAGNGNSGLKHSASRSSH